jgi:hypothetical protein
VRRETGKGLQIRLSLCQYPVLSRKDVSQRRAVTAGELGVAGKALDKSA